MSTFARLASSLLPIGFRIRHPPSAYLWCLIRAAMSFTSASPLCVLRLGFLAFDCMAPDSFPSPARGGPPGAEGGASLDVASVPSAARRSAAVHASRSTNSARRSRSVLLWTGFLRTVTTSPSAKSSRQSPHGWDEFYEPFHGLADRCRGFRAFVLRSGQISMGHLSTIGG